MAEFDFRFEHGAMHFPAEGLWLDAHRAIGPEETVFVSHAHSDHTAAHARVILSPPTQRLMRSRVGGKRQEHVLKFHHRTAGADLGLRTPETHVTLLPAGHILGSAMILLERNGASLLYTGDFKLRPGLSAEFCEPRPADVLVMETTFGRPHYVFPAVTDLMAGVVRFCREALDNDETPVLLAYSLGKSQEVLAGLAGAGLPIALCEPVARMTSVYASLGWSFPPYETLDFRTAAGKVILAPPGMALEPLRRKLGPTRVAALTGWAVDSGCRYQHGSDAAFPLSDHADFPDLVEFVRRVAPRQVYTLHGFAADFAAHLRTLGFQAQALSQSEQLELVLGNPAVVAGNSPTTARPAPRSEKEPRPTDPVREASAQDFLHFASVCTTIGAAPDKSEKVNHLARFLAGLNPVLLSSVIAWLIDAETRTPPARSMSADWGALRDAICTAAGASRADFNACHLTHSDLGETAAELLLERPSLEDARLLLTEVVSLSGALASLRESRGKRPLLARHLARCGPVEARFLVRVLTGSLRIGLNEERVEQAIALAFGADPGAVRVAHQVTGILGEAAALAQAGRLMEAELVPFRAVKLIRASLEADAAALWVRVTQWFPADAPASAWIEDHHAGIRCQLHKVGSRVALFSIDRRDITARFPGIATAAAKWVDDMILDGVLVTDPGVRAFRSADLHRGRSLEERPLFPESDRAVRFIAFDLLWRAGRSHLMEPLLQRRAQLESLNLPHAIALSEGRIVRDASGIETAFEAARARGSDGLVLKHAGSTCLPDRSGPVWLKMTS